MIGGSDREDIILMVSLIVLVCMGSVTGGPTLRLLHDSTITPPAASDSDDSVKHLPSLVANPEENT